MVENGQDETDTAMMSINNQGLPAVQEPDKKNMMWMAGVVDCISTVLSLFGREEQKPAEEEEWDVPYESLTLFDFVGSGAQGKVFCGIFRNEMVAVKKLQDKKETDIEHLRNLNHENIVRFRGVCTQAPNYCVIMEYCQYGPLYNYIHSGVCLSADRIIKWAKEIANGMTYLHAQKIIHRDLKSLKVWMSPGSNVELLNTTNYYPGVPSELTCILVADNLVAKVSDFGNSLVWNDVSTVMSNAGTYAWMAPEVIKSEPCSEKMDVWSYGVVLWELFTQEIPYKKLGVYAIYFGVGNDTISLPVPSTCPDSLKQLLSQCWNRVSKNRPSFKMISAQLDVVADEFKSIMAECFSVIQASWRKEVEDGMVKMHERAEKPQPPPQDVQRQRREELRQGRDLKNIYEQKLLKVNEFLMEICAISLQLEEREKAVEAREKACRCDIRKNYKQYQRQISSSSDGATPICVQKINSVSHQPRKKKQETQMVVNYVENKKDGSTVTITIDESAYGDECVHNNNVETVTPKETVVEKNGNIDLLDSGKELVVNDNYVPEVAQV